MDGEDLAGYLPVYIESPRRGLIETRDGDPGELTLAAIRSLNVSLRDRDEVSALQALAILQFAQRRFG